MVAFFYGPGSGADIMLPLRRTRRGSSFVAAKKIVKKACMYTFLWRYFIGIRQVEVSFKVEIVNMYHFS